MTRDEIKSLLIDHLCDHPSGELLDRLASRPEPFDRKAVQAIIAQIDDELIVGIGHGAVWAQGKAMDILSDLRALATNDGEQIAESANCSDAADFCAENAQKPGEGK